MTKIILAVWLAVFGGDVQRLSDPVFRVREAATKRLEAAGWWAAGVWLVEPATPEAEDRIARVIERLTRRLPFAVQLWACCADDLSDEFVLEREEEVYSFCDLWGPDVCSIPATGYTVHLSCHQVRDIVSHPPWYTGSRAGDLRMLLKNFKEIPDERKD